MSFLSAAFLLALPLIAVPIAIHFYRGKQRDVVLWGAMQFLAVAATKGRRMERIEELILMALRLAAVAALVLALARPMIRSTWLGRGSEREVVLVLDNSMSMARLDNGEAAADRLREKAAALVDTLSASDGVQILLTVGGIGPKVALAVVSGTGIAPAVSIMEFFVPVAPSMHLDPVRLGPGEYFVLGDNSPVSNDSRTALAVRTASRACSAVPWTGCLSSRTQATK